MIITVLSVDEDHPPETLGMVAASAALSISQIPFEGPIGACRVTWDGNNYAINPSFQRSNSADLNMVVASNRDAIMMVESGSVEVSEEVILEGIRLAHESNVQTIELIDRLVAERGADKTEVHFDYSETEERQKKVDALVNGRISEVLERNSFKSERDSSLDAVESEVAAQLADDYSSGDIAEAFKNLVKKEVRGRILNQNVRPDGRQTTEIRPITCSVGELPRAHGSGLFTRGQTQVLSIATLASLSMKQTLDTVGPENTKQFMHHYNFPPYSVGEARRVGSPGRREIGHGALAERAILAAMPSEEDFPYTVRVVSEVLASNGSTSMGSVCGSSMALMDAGVPLRAPVAGIAMGLITDADSDRYAILSDIQGIEDFLGDMDFKVAGTRKGHQRPADGRQDRRPDPGTPERGPGAGSCRPPAHPGPHVRGHHRAEGPDEPVCPQAGQDADPRREDRRPHRPRRSRHPRHPGGDRLRHRRFRRRRRHHLLQRPDHDRTGPQPGGRADP